MMNATDNIVYNTAVAFGIPAAVAQLIVGQAGQESSLNGVRYASDLAVNYNNLFGMTFVGQANAVQGPLQPESNGQVYYASYPGGIQDSVTDLCKWLVNRQNDGTLTIANLTTPQLYAQALYDNDYYEGPSPQTENDYAAGITSIVNDVFGAPGNTGNSTTGTPDTQGGGADQGVTLASTGGQWLFWAAAIGLGLLIIRRK